MSTTVPSVPLSTRSGLVKIPERGREGGGARERVRERARAREIVNYLKKLGKVSLFKNQLCLPKVLSPSGSTSCAIFRASVVAMSTLLGTTTKLIVSCFVMKLWISLFI